MNRKMAATEVKDLGQYRPLNQTIDKEPRVLVLIEQIKKNLQEQNDIIGRLSSRLEKVSGDVGPSPCDPNTKQPIARQTVMNDLSDIISSIQNNNSWILDIHDKLEV